MNKQNKKTMKEKQIKPKTTTTMKKQDKINSYTTFNKAK